VAALERAHWAGRGARDGQDIALLVNIASDVGSLPFTARQLWVRRRHNPELVDALLEADVSSIRELGSLLRRLEGAPVGGWVVTRGRKQRAGVVWRLTRASD
jgi:hypothetical protein